jgi:N-acetylglutamate synthase-like GNAT family acetyltransferase
MLNTSKSEEHTEEQDCGLDTLQFLEQLEEEAKSLNEEKINLLDLQEKLWFRISEEIENKRQKNEELKKEVEELKKKCEEISRILNIYTQKREPNSVQVTQI